MPAYIIARVHVTDAARYAEYMKITPGIIKKFGPPAKPMSLSNQNH
jgi:uncharacterized protein (DUF1330 family)